MTTRAEMMAILTAPTPPEDIRWVPGKIQQNPAKDRCFALAMPYVDARFVQRRLDEACGPLGWRSDVREVAGRIFVGLAIRDPETDEWVWRWDTGGAAHGEAGDEGKALVSTGLKRCGYQFGIGRDIYDLQRPWLECDCTTTPDGRLTFRRWLTVPKPMRRNSPTRTTA